MRTTRLSQIVTLVAILTALGVARAPRDVAAEPIFASPPHYVADADGRRVVLFLNEPVSGALASRGPDGSYEVRVPRSEVAPDIQGQDFGADGWGNGGDAVRHFVLASGAKGDTHIHIQPNGPIGGVDAHTADDPPRLVIELLGTEPTRTPAPTRTAVRSPAPKATSTTAKNVAVKTARPEPTATPRPRATAKPSSPMPTATAKVEPVAIAVAQEHAPKAPTVEALAHATVLTALAAPVPAARVDVHAAPVDAEAAPVDAQAAPVEKPAPSEAAPSVSPPAAEPPAAAKDTRSNAPAAPEPVTHRAATSGALVAPVALPSPAALAAPVPTIPRIPGALSPFGLGCLWRRVAGVAFCAADPKAPAYVGDRTVTAMVGAIARGKLPEAEDRPALETPALAFLEADLAFVTRAPDGKLLPVVEAYRRALRQHRDFPEAWRARLNIALAYRAMEFRTELKTVAGEAVAVADPTAGLIRGIAGDLDVVTGYLPAATDEYRRAADGGGVGPCVAARGRARLALAENDATTAATELSALGSLCPTDLQTDPETGWVRARLALAQHDFATARTLLTDVEPHLGKSDRGAVIADLGAVAEAAGDPKAARTSYEKLLPGTYGARAARQATVRLAILDGEGGDVSAGLKRLERLTPEASDPARRALVMRTARSALDRGQAGEAIAALHDARVDPTQLGLEEQLVVAEAYRSLGLFGEAERVLAVAQVRSGAAPGDALFAERGRLALARRDGAAALAIADEWIRARGRSSGALALRAQAVAAAGDGVGAHAAVAAAVIEDPNLSRTLALDVAEALRERAPGAALVLAREALEPGPTAELPPARAAAGLALVGALAEAAGDEDTALAAFTTLTARYGKEPIAADAAYRAARLAALRVPSTASAAFDEAARSKDPLSRRVAGAARDYEAIVRPLGGAAKNGTLGSSGTPPPAPGKAKGTP